MFLEDVIEITQIMSITIVVSTITSIYSSKFFGKEISRYNFIATICGASTSVIGVLILGQIYGIYGVAVAFVLSNVSICLCLTVCDKIYYKKRQLD